MSKLTKRKYAKRRKTTCGYAEGVDHINIKSLRVPRDKNHRSQGSLMTDTYISTIGR